ncbi:MAG: TonB-dependent receptor [Bacteroidota bacterium]
MRSNAFLAGFLLFFCLSASPSIGQDAPDNITIEVKDVTLDEVLVQLMERYDLLIAYDVRKAREITVSIDVKNASIDEVLDEVLADTGLTYQKNAQGIIIKSKPEPDGEDNDNGQAILLKSVEGRIQDEQTGEFLPYATISLKGTSQGASSNVDGWFTIHNVPDTAALVIDYLGFFPQEIKVGDVNDKLTIALKSQSQQLEEVIINYDVVAVDVKSDAGHLVFNPREVTGLPNLGEVDVFRSLQLLPGISATNETSTGLVIRGSTPDQNLILFDGFSVFQVDHFFGVFSAFNHHAIKDIQVYKGGFDARYGGRTSAVVDITGKSGNRNKTSANIGANLISFNGSVEVPLGDKWTVLFAARRAFTDVIRSGLYQNLIENVRNNDTDSPQTRLGFTNEDLIPEFRFFDVNAKLSFRPSKRDELSFSFYGGEDNLRLFAASQEEFLFSNINDQLTWGNTGVSLRWARQWNAKWHSQVRLAVSEYENRSSLFSRITFDNGIDSLGFQSESTFINNVTDAQLTVDVEWQPNEKYTAVFGASSQGNETSLVTQLSEQDDTLSNTEFDQQGEIFSFYWQNYYRPIPNLKLNAGLRYYTIDLIENNVFFEPRLGFSYSITPEFSLKGAWGRYHQFVNRVINNDVNDGLPDFWLLADGEVPQKESEHWVAGFNYTKDKWSIDIEAYHKQTDQVLDFLPLGRYFPAELLPNDQFVVGESRTKGIDFLVTRSTDNYTGWLGYSLSEAESLFLGLNDNLPFPANEDQRHEFKTTHLVSLKRWKLSATWVYASSRPFTAPSGQFTTPTLTGEPVITFSIESVNAQRLPDYHRMDISAGYTFDLGKWSVESGLSVYNLYDRRNIKFTRFDATPFTVDDGILRDQAILSSFDVELLGLTPNIFVNFKL